jgi:hypothetical protein
MTATNILKYIAIKSWTFGGLSLWAGCTAIALPDKTSAIAEAGAVVAASGILILVVAIVGTLAVGVTTLLSE